MNGILFAYLSILCIVLFIGGEVLSTPSYESVGLGSNAGPGSQYTAHPADHPPSQAD